MDFLTKEKFNALVAACDNRTGSGRRDMLILLLLYNTGAWVSELTTLKGKDLIIENTQVCIHITGKGRKERTVPLWKNTSKCLLHYMKLHSVTENDKLLMNYAGQELTRSGVRYRISCLVKKASSAMPSLNMKNVIPHTLDILLLFICYRPVLIFPRLPYGSAMKVLPPPTNIWK